MKRTIAAVGMLVTAATLLIHSSCTGPPPGWQPISRDEWQWHHRDDLWFRGVPADGQTFESSKRGKVVRCELVNLGEGVAEVTLEGGHQSGRWTLNPGQVHSLQLGGFTGPARFSAPDDVVIASPRVGRESDAARLVVLILVDTLRADHVTAELMPGVTEYFENGFQWRQATANSSWTLPSVASFFTSRSVLDLTAPTGDLIGIPSGLSTLARELEQGGFVTGAVVANYSVAVQNGFGEGFSNYQVPDSRNGKSHPDGSWVVDAGREWLRRHSGEDAFLYLHLMDPHHPYRSHDDPTTAVPDLLSLANRQREEIPGERALLSKLYAGEVRHVDALLTPFLRELPEDALVVFTSDHGESLGERGCWGHGLNLYQESLVVPLLMRGPSVAARAVDGEVQLLDLTPTILDLLDLPTGHGMTGRSLLEGGSEKPVVSATFGAGPLRWSWRRGDTKVLLRMAPQPGLGAVARSRMREGTPLEAGVFEFDLQQDPEEEQPKMLNPELLDPVLDAFAHTAGRMVPGLQIVSSNRQGPNTATVNIDGTLDVVQAWSLAPMMLSQTNGQLTVSCRNAYPFCWLAVRVEPPPAAVFSQGVEYLLSEQHPPSTYTEGVRLWWNPLRPIEVHGQEETLARLRALGYIP